MNLFTGNQGVSVLFFLTCLFRRDNFVDGFLYKTGRFEVTSLGILSVLKTIKD